MFRTPSPRQLVAFMGSTLKFAARISFPVPDLCPSAFRQDPTSSGAILASSPLPCPSIPESIPYLIRFENVLQPLRDYFLGNDIILQRKIEYIGH